jgi:hypothetical protein
LADADRVECLHRVGVGEQQVSAVDELRGEQDLHNPQHNVHDACVPRRARLIGHNSTFHW